MKLKSRSLIKYFGKDTINKNTIAKQGNVLKLDWLTYDDFDLGEVSAILKKFPKIQNVIILTDSPEKLDSIVKSLPDYVAISLGTVPKKLFDGISQESLNRIAGVSITGYGKTDERINIGELLQKFSNVNYISYNCQIPNDSNVVSDFQQIDELLKRSQQLDLAPELMEAYKKYVHDNPHLFEKRVFFGSQSAYSEEKIEMLNANPNNYYWPACTLKGAQDFSKLTAAKDKKIVLLANSMVDIPLEVVERLKQQGVSCEIHMQSYDNSVYQNQSYELDEFLAMSQKMNELIGDIDESLPEEEKFRLIYERIASSIEYDYPAGYPKDSEEKKYSRENLYHCRNLRNGLLYGKTVCAGYADILKNACLLKGIECEYIQGPVDSVMDKNYYLRNRDKSQNQNSEPVYADKNSVITREHHAWNKVKINGVWYNCDPTWDRNDIISGIIPTYALCSDELYKKTGRPTVEVARHPCNDGFQDKKRIFHDLSDSRDLVVSNKIIEFESTVDEYGKPREFPAISKNSPWIKLLNSLSEFAKKQRQNATKLIRKIRTKMNPDYYKTEEIPIVGDTAEITEPLSILEDTAEITEPLPIPPVVEVSKEDIEPEKKPSWEVSDEIKRAVNVASFRQTKPEIQNPKETYEHEIGEN